MLTRTLLAATAALVLTSAAQAQESAAQTAPETPAAEEESDAPDGSIESGLAPRRAANRPRGNPHGTVFLVDVQTREVVWSAFIGEYDRSPKSLHREAKEVVSALRKGLATP